MQSEKNMTLGELADRIGGELEGDGRQAITGAAPLGQAGEEDVSFLANDKYRHLMETTSAAAVIVARDYAGPGGRLIRCSDPYLAFRETMVLLYGFRTPYFTGVDPAAHIDSTAQIGKDVSIAPGVSIAGETAIGSGTAIYPGVFIGRNCRIGAGCTIYPNSVIYNETVLGDRVTIHACSSIGQDGFGYATHENDDGIVVHDKIPQSGRVIIENDVEIGACCAIERAALGATVIGAGTKFADLVAIGHGTKVGKHCLLVSQAGIAGSTTVGDYCSFAGQCGIVGHISIGDRVRVGAKAGVINDVDSDIEVLGAPALPRTQAKKIVISTMRLPEMAKKIKSMEDEIKELRARIEDRGHDG